jgi:hypothetical protein
MSPFLGILNPWAVPSADKRVSDVAQVLSGSVTQRVYASLDGQSGVALNIQKNSTAISRSHTTSRPSPNSNSKAWNTRSSRASC